MNPDFAMVLNFKFTGSQFDPDFLVKTARNIGARAVSGSEKLKAACQKYTIFLAQPQDGQNLKADNVLAAMMSNKKAGKRTIINVPLEANGQFNQATKQMFNVINKWMHLFGHAFNEGQPSPLKVSPAGFVLENRHASYQKYVFLKTPLPTKIRIQGLTQKPSQVEWIANRIPLTSDFQAGELRIKLTKPDQDLAWQVLRIQAHRPEDDLASTKF